MKVTYELTEKDIWSHYAFSYFHRHPRSGVFSAVVLLFVVLNIITRAINYSPDQFEPLSLFIGIPLFLILRQVYAVKVKLKRMGFYGTYSFEVSTEGYTVRTPNVSEQSKWSRISEVRVSRSHYFLFNQANAAYIIPKRSFASDREGQEFVDAVIAAMKQESGQAPVTAPKKPSRFVVAMFTIISLLIVMGIINSIVS